MITEINNDIFNEAIKIKENFLFVHCMNITLNTRLGIVKLFEEKFNIKQKILNKYDKKKH